MDATIKSQSETKNFRVVATHETGEVRVSGWMTHTQAEAERRRYFGGAWVKVEVESK